MSNFANYLLKDSEKVDKKIFINNKIKYSQLNKIVNNVSKKILIDFKNKLFGLSLGLSEEFLIFYLAIIQSGNTVVLLETGLSNERYVEICKKFKISFFITDKKIQDINLKLIKKNFADLDIDKSINNLNLYSLNSKNKQNDLYSNWVFVA